MTSIVVLLLASTLFWNFSMRAAPRSGRGTRGQVAGSQAIEDFDIRDRRNKDAVLKFERRMEKLSSRQKEKNVGLKLVMDSARERNAGSVEGLAVTYYDLTNSPEVVEAKPNGHRFLTPPSSQPRENVVRSFLNEHTDLFGMSPQKVAGLRKTAEYTTSNCNSSLWTLNWRPWPGRWSCGRIRRPTTCWSTPRPAFCSGASASPTRRRRRPHTSSITTTARPRSLRQQRCQAPAFRARPSSVLSLPSSASFRPSTISDGSPTG